MKRVLLLVSVCVLCLVAACGERTAPEPKVDAASSVEPSPTSLPSPTPSPTPAPTPTPTPTPEPKVEPMSYDEYFSEERKLENIVYESPMYDDQWENGKIYLRSSREVLAERPERWDILAGKGGASDELLIYDDKRIYITENCGRDRLLVFEAESEIEPVHNPDPSTLFTFIDGTKRYRIYTPTCTVDFMFDLPGVLTEAEMTELWRVGKLPDDALYVWTEELVNNHTWQVQIAGQSDEWVAALAAYEGVTVEEFVNTDGASWRVSVYYDSQNGEWELTKKAEFVRDFVELG